MATNASLVFGSVPLLKPGTPPTTAYLVRALGPGLSWGELDAVISSIASQLMDGDQAEITRFGNRVLTVPVQIEGDTLDTVAAGEAALMAEVNKGRNALTWKPPGTSTSGVYDVIYAELQHNFDDLDELRVVRQFTLTLTCLPGVRREAMTTVVATPIPSAPTTTLIDNCGSATGWSAGTVVSGDLQVTADGASLALTERTGLTVGIGAPDYVVVTMVHSGSQIPTFKLNGTIATIAATVPAGILNEKRYFLRLSGAFTLNTLSIQVAALPTGSVVTIQQVDKYNQLPTVGSPRQRSFTVNIGGTMRTSADLLIESSSAAVGLGDEVLVYTTRVVGLTPALRPYLHSSALPSATAATPLVSGGWQDIGTTPSVYRVPLASVRPGTYALMSRSFSDITRTRGVNWSCQMSTDWANNTNIAETGSVSLALTADGRFYQLGVLSLPLAQVGPDNTGYLEVTLQGTGGNDNRLDELYLLNLDEGELTWLSGLTRASDSATPSKVMLQNATLDSEGLPRWMVGTTGTGDADVSAADRLLSLGVHKLSGGAAATVFVVTPDETTQTVTASAYERFAHNVPEPT